MKIERKKLILIIAAIATVLIAALVITLSIITGGGKTEPKPVTTPTAVANDSPNSEVEQGAPVKDPEASGAPPESIYSNDYSKDTGYNKLPADFSSSTSNTKDTVFDPEWANYKLNTLMCELSNKETVTQRAIQPLEDFQTDLTRVGTDNAASLSVSISKVLNAYIPLEGQRAPGNVKAELSIYCNVEDVE